MTTTINADSSNGFKVTADTSSILALQTNGTTAISIDASQAVSFTNSPTVTGGTANGVAYLNGSKVLTTGSALTWDGSLLSTTVADNTVGVKFKATTSNIRFLPQDGGAAKIAALNAAESAFYPLITQGSSLQYVIDTTEGMRLTSTGLGIGTSSPTAKLQIGVASAAVDGTKGVRISNAGGGIVMLENGSNNDSYVGTLSASDFCFRTNNTERARIDSSGNLLVGTTSATGTLTVKGTSTARAGTVISLTDSSAGNLFKIANDGLITTGGAANPYGNTTATGANAVFAADGVFYRSTSALKYKQDIRDIESIDIAKFRPIRYKSKCNGDDQTLDHFGIVADEVDQAGIKELVSYGIDGQVEGFQYERLTVVLLKAIQEQSALITQLTARITALESA